MRGNNQAKIDHFKDGPIKKILYFTIILALILTNSMVRKSASATGCKDIKIVFARGSGETRNTNESFLTFNNALKTKLDTTDLSYEFIDLDYPAVAINDIGTMLGAYFGAGDAYAFGESIEKGSRKLTNMIAGDSCTNTKYVIAGYSQGAMVVSKSLQNISRDRLIYAATFGDPKIYLPEGEGLIPAACKGENLSDYRAYVPDCQAYKGLLGAYIPYEPSTLVGKVGTWCNKRDIFCSSHISINDHTSYIADDIYEDASKTIFMKIVEQFDIENNAFSPHDTAFLIDSTGSMYNLLSKYKEEISKLAQSTLDAGGRIALFEFRDLLYDHEPVEHCNFENCTLEVFLDELQSIEADGGGDDPESVLSASLHAMKTLNWKFGSTKSIIVISDIYYLDPDRDGTTLEEVVKLSKEIDPVHIYPIVPASEKDAYLSLAEETGGLVSTSVEEFKYAEEVITEMEDGAPSVIESEPIVRPTLTIDEASLNSDGIINVKFSGDMESAIVALNDAVLGKTTENEISISGINLSIENVLSLVPVGVEARGDPAQIVLVPNHELEEDIEARDEDDVVNDEENNALKDNENYQNNEDLDDATKDEIVKPIDNDTSVIKETSKIVEDAEEAYGSANKIEENGRSLVKEMGSPFLETKIINKVDISAAIPKAPDTGKPLGS